ncbi:hypothetical protein DEVEQU_02325 [Devosia equisanguinis]|uniref:Uncharacterized protein n=1 Tax=Devosia equisanguinis TaxID=2490941 RepID=A0A447ICI5_9HYPH|nr:hypothetical protein DEVEQU_02325 [Devosia equisanguinis]
MPKVSQLVSYAALVAAMVLTLAITVHFGAF